MEMERAISIPPYGGKSYQYLTCCFICLLLTSEAIFAEIIRREVTLLSVQRSQFNEIDPLPTPPRLPI